MKTPTRTLTIETFNPNGRLMRTSNASLIRLKGCWLKPAGFHSGAQVIVNNPSSGVIELRVCSSMPIDAACFVAVQRRDSFLK